MNHFMSLVSLTVLGLFVNVGWAPAEGVKIKQKGGERAKIVQAAKLADAFAKDSEKAGQDFSPQSAGMKLKITGRVTKVAKGEVLLNNADAEVQVYVAVGNRKVKLGDLVEATVTRLKYHAASRSILVESDKVTIAPEDSSRVKGVRFDKQ